MAVLKFSEGKAIHDFDLISIEIGSLGVLLISLQVNKSEALKKLLEKESLNEAEKLEALQLYDLELMELQSSKAYASRDLLVLNSDEQTKFHLKKFGQYHVHNGNEGRYVVDGECIFQFPIGADRALTLTVQQGEFIEIPANTEHRLSLSNLQRAKIIRFFGKEGELLTQYTRANTLVSG